MKLQIAIGEETDGRWIAEIETLPGVLCYGVSRVDAVAALRGHRSANACPHSEAHRIAPKRSLSQAQGLPLMYPRISSAIASLAC